MKEGWTPRMGIGERGKDWLSEALQHRGAKLDHHLAVAEKCTISFYGITPVRIPFFLSFRQQQSRARWHVLG